MKTILELNPQGIWRNFYKLTQIPRPSGHLEKIQQFLLDFAKENQVEAFIDEAGNVVMRKAATPGMENRKTVTLQAHMDMVPQKAPESNHDFVKDPIETHIEDNWVKANKTTLGADNGIGVAAIMAVMEDKTLKHGPVEGLITADEETGMFGANDLPTGELQGDILLNLDSETWGKFVIGSAGGIDIDITTNYLSDQAAADQVAFTLTIQGLKGGHSGLEIHEGRANANKLMARILQEAAEKVDARLIEWHGGNMRNAIPFKAVTTLAVAPANESKLMAIVEEYKKVFNDEFHFTDNPVQVDIEKCITQQKPLAKEEQKRIIDAIYACHDGVLRMIPDVPGVVETSSNLSIIDICEGKADIKILARSSSETMKKYIAQMQQSCFEGANMEVKLSGAYQGWNPNTNSEILKLLLKQYKEIFGEEAVVQADHAGLECSIILSKYPHMDVVSLGPTIRSPHTANERADIPTTELFWTLLKNVLENIPVK